MTILSAQDALINALTHLKNYEFDRDFLEKTTAIDIDHSPQAFFSFGIGSQHFAVSAQAYCEVLMDINLAAIPNAPTQLVGLCNLRGNLIPVYQLHHGLEAALPKKTIVFCVGRGEKAVGLLIDALPTSINLKPYEILHPNVHENAQESSQMPALMKRISSASYFSKARVLHLLEGDQLGNILLQLTSGASLLSNIEDVRAVD